MACLRWNPVTATNSSRMRPFPAPLPLLYRSMPAATSSSRVAMLTRLIAISPTPSGSGAFQMRQRINIREHFWRGNAHRIEHVADVVVGGNAADAEQGLAVRAAVAGLKLALMIQEGRALGEEHRQGGQADVGHGILAVGSRALVREPLTAAPHDAQQAVEHLHPDLESDPTGQE